MKLQGEIGNEEVKGTNVYDKGVNKDWKPLGKNNPPLSSSNINSTLFEHDININVVNK